MRSKKIIAGTAAIALIASSTAAATGASSARPATTKTRAPNAWMMLSLLGSTQAAAVDGKSTEGTQPTNEAPLAAPPPSIPRHEGGSLLVTGILDWWLFVACKIATIGHQRFANSPG